jgi:hypothetical protein
MLVQQLASYVDPRNKVAIKTKEKGTMLILRYAIGQIIKAA